MSEDTIRLVTIGRIFRRRWRLLVLLTLVGALAGYGASVVFPPRYTAQASVLLPGQWEERELLTQADVATSSAVVDRAAGTLDGPKVSGEELRGQVSAKAADGNIIRIAGTAETPERAQRIADRVAQQFVTFAARVAGGNADAEGPTEPETLRLKVAETNRRITELAKAADPGRTVESVQARTSLEKLRSGLEEAMQKLEDADSVTDKAGMVVMGPADRPTGQAPPTRTQLVAGGALLFLVVAVLGHLVATRADRRPRTEPEIAAALGATPLGTVDVPAGRAARRAKGRGPGGLRRLLGLDTRWDVPPPRASADEAGRRLRYRRVCARLRDQLPTHRHLLAVVPEGDETARRAAGQLATEAASEQSAGADGRGFPLLRVVEVAVDGPLVPDRGTESGAVVVLSAGVWSAGELAGVAGACADGGHEVLGVVVAGPVQTRPARSGDRERDDTTMALALPGQGTGGPA